MKKNFYANFAMSAFNNLEEKAPSLSVDRKSFELFTQRLALGQENVIKKYGNLKALNRVFIKEVLSYYQNVLNLSEKDAIAIMGKGIRDSNILEEGKDTEESVIIYPSFRHVRHKEGKVSHIPVFEVYLLNEADFTSVNPDILDDEMKTLDSFLQATAYDIAAYWTKDKDGTEEENNLIGMEILTLTVIKNKVAYKKDILQYLAEDTGNQKLLRFV